MSILYRRKIYIWHAEHLFHFPVHAKRKCIRRFIVFLYIFSRCWFHFKHNIYLRPTGIIIIIIVRIFEIGVCIVYMNRDGYVYGLLHRLDIVISVPWFAKHKPDRTISRPRAWWLTACVYIDAVVLDMEFLFGCFCVYLLETADVSYIPNRHAII